MPDDLRCSSKTIREELADLRRRVDKLSWLVILAILGDVSGFREAVQALAWP